MPFYHRVGEIPRRRHTTFFKPDGKTLYREELSSTLGFSGVYSNKYRIGEPTRVLKVKELPVAPPPEWSDAPIQHYHFNTDTIKKGGDFVTCRVPYILNGNCVISTGLPTESSTAFYRNAYAHEIIFVHKGRGAFLSEYGRIRFEEGDQIVIPKGITTQMSFDSPSGNKILVVESDTPFDIPRHYRNEYGQLEEHAPYQERDFKLPEFMAPTDKAGEFLLHLRTGGRLFEYTLDHHPFDVVGWDGFLYPFAFNIKDYCPKVGRLHLPPPTHLVFQTKHFVYCNFCPRPYDFDPQSIPAPYFHSNVDSDEMLYYAGGDFMSRTGVQEGSITLHPTGIAHGPQPGRTEASIGAKGTNEYAVMVDTFYPMRVTTNVRESMDPSYMTSWLPRSQG